jgi:hypothetical protein
MPPAKSQVLHDEMHREVISAAFLSGTLNCFRDPSTAPAPPHRCRALDRDGPLSRSFRTRKSFRCLEHFILFVYNNKQQNLCTAVQRAGGGTPGSWS